MIKLMHFIDLEKLRVPVLEVGTRIVDDDK